MKVLVIIGISILVMAAFGIYAAIKITQNNRKNGQKQLLANYTAL